VRDKGKRGTQHPLGGRVSFRKSCPQSLAGRRKKKPRKGKSEQGSDSQYLVATGEFYTPETYAFNRTVLGIHTKRAV